MTFTMNSMPQMLNMNWLSVKSMDWKIMNKDQKELNDTEKDLITVLSFFAFIVVPILLLIYILIK